MIRNGYMTQLKDNPRRYKEPNNMSYRKERDWSKTAVEKLKEAKLVVEVRRENL